MDKERKIAFYTLVSDSFKENYNNSICFRTETKKGKY